jgi:hypothetical protein
MGTPANLHLVPSPLETQWVELFRAGNYGAKGVYTKADVAGIVANYNPTFHEAPACIGHPADNMPAYGWVAALKDDAGTLLAKFKDVVPAFGEAVQQRRFPKRSVAFYKTPQGLSLRHVAFLGALPPEVKGLADVKFADNGEVTEVIFQEEPTMPAELDTEKVASSLWEKIKSLVPAASATTTPQFSEADNKAAIDAAVEAAMKPIREAETKRLTEFAEAEKKLKLTAHSTRAAEAIAKVKAAGAWVPAFDKQGLPAIFSELAKVTETVEFSEGEGDKKVTVQKTPLELLVTFMEGLKKIVPDGRLVTLSESTTTRKKTAANADPNSDQLNELTKKYMVDNKVEFAEALSKVASEHPELTVAGGATAGVV